MKKKTTYLVLGLGKTGTASAHYLHSQGMRVHVYDDHPSPLLHQELLRLVPTADCYLGATEPAMWRDVEAVLASPGFTMEHPVAQQATARGIAVMSDIQLFADRCDAPIVGITGTNGKSTTTALIGHLLQSCGYKAGVGGNIGTPALSLLMEDPADFYVLELSSFQLDLTNLLACDVVTLLNVTEDHLDRYGHFDNYIKSKRRLLAWGKQAVYNRQDLCTWPENPDQHISFGLDQPLEGCWGIVEHDGQNYLAKGSELMASVALLPLIGQHNWANILAALAMGDCLGLNAAQMCAALASFRGLAHRCELVGEKNDVRWINDSKGTNVAATHAAICGVQQQITGQVIWLAGGVAKGQSFDSLVPLSHQIRHTILFGQDAKFIGDAMVDHTAITYVNDLKEAVLTAQSCAQPGDVVLLSPACASLDMFIHFMERGDTFKQLVRTLIL